MFHTLDAQRAARQLFKSLRSLRYSELSNKKFAELELKHIQIELENNRYQHLRHFVDQYFCYKNGYVKKTGTANWEGIVWNENVSLNAKSENNRKKVVKEHVIPLKRITQELEKLVESKKTKLEEIAECLDRLVVFATITKDEDKRLREAKLHSKMPSAYDQVGHELYKDPFARYKVVGIQYETKA